MPIQDEELREERCEEMNREAAEEEYSERRMRDDEEYCVEHFSLDTNSTIGEFREALESINEYGWNMSEQQLLDYI